MQLDWEVKNYDFNARECLYPFHDVRFIALRSELARHPEARPGDLLLTFRDNGDAEKIIEHFNGYNNFRGGSVANDVEGTMVNVLLAPVDRPRGRR